jgi:hypothetical protein
MYFYVTNLHVSLRNNRLFVLFAVVFVCNFLLTPCVGLSIDPNGGINLLHESSSVDDNNPANDSSGCTVLLSYSKETFKENPISSFMYFVPLISPTGVDRQTSANNTQQVGIITYEKKMTSKSFSVICEFEILGKGFHKNTFDPAGMMALFIGELKKGQSLTNMLDYIQFEGEGFGRIEVKGTIAGSVQTVTEMNMQFNAKGHKSPVTIGLYDVKTQDGQYTYENRSNEVVARVNSLVFKKSKKDPRMGIKVASISKIPDSEGFWDGIRGTIANLLIRPPKVDKLGNDTMLEFGHALLRQEPEFTFPKAKNIQDDRIVVMYPEKNKSR